MVRVVGVKDLGLVLQPAKGLGVDNAVTISLILGSIGMGFLRIAPPFRQLISHGVGGQPHFNDYILARIDSSGGFMGETILGFLLVAAILSFSALITQGCDRAMYNRCQGCGTRNAKRRVHCRNCGEEVRS